MPALITTTTLDSAADPEGYYTVILGEQLDNGRYQVFSSVGKGMFANVVRARVLLPEPGETTAKEVAIKIVRCQESMYVRLHLSHNAMLISMVGIARGSRRLKFSISLFRRTRRIRSISYDWNELLSIVGICAWCLSR